MNATADASPETVAQAIDGKPDLHWRITSGGDGVAKTAVFQFRDRLCGYDGGTRLSLGISSNFFAAQSPGRIRVSITTDPDARASGVPADIEQILLVPPAQRTPEQLAAVRRQFLLTTPLLANQQQAIRAARAAVPELPTTLVMQERARPRVTQVHHRGEYMQPEGAVEPGVPHVLPPLPKGAPHDRLALARWLVGPENPLIGRVTMNRIWAQYFGRGLVATLDDFGTMGEPPSHPELLDWLATELPRQGWSLKAMHRLIVTSATYRQSSHVTPKLMERDAPNVLLARAPRLRVEAEIVRDIAMTASGLLTDHVGGPSVFPPQPPNISEAAFEPFKWPTSDGPDRYRRGMYTFLKRSAPYPAQLTFDGTSAESTCTRRNRSNTPLQALTTLNDTVYLEAARAMARRVMNDCSTADATARARYAMRLCVGREPEDDEVSRLVVFHDAQLARFEKKSPDPTEVALAEREAAPPDVNLNELAAWTTVCRAVLNLDETITRE
jgi:hypothetical protein